MSKTTDLNLSCPSSVAALEAYVSKAVFRKIYLLVECRRENSTNSAIIFFGFGAGRFILHRPILP